MPVMNGYQFFRSVKEEYPEHNHTPFILLTALSDRQDELKGLRLGVDDYLTKPIDFELLTIRVEASLRRAVVRPDQITPATLPLDSDPDTTNETKAARVNEMIALNDGRLLTGKFETISLDAIRDRVGDRWSAISRRILTSAEAVVTSHLGPKDVYHITAKQDFIVCFADISDDEIDGRVSQIRDAVWDRLFDETDNEELAQVDAHAHTLSLEIDNSEDLSEPFSGIDQLIEQQKTVSQETSQRKLHQVYHYENLFAVTLMNASGSPSKIKMLTFEQKFADLTRELLRGGRWPNAFLLDLQKILFQRLLEKRTLQETFSHAAMLLPINFAMFKGEEARKGLTALCHDLENNMDTDLLIDIVDTPDRIKTQKKSLMALPVGRKVQSLELRRTAQIDGLELGELRQLGVALVSMRYDDVINHDELSLRHLIKMLEQAGTKFLIKEIPEGKLYEAQIRKAHLYAMRT